MLICIATLTWKGRPRSWKKRYQKLREKIPEIGRKEPEIFQLFLNEKFSPMRHRCRFHVQSRLVPFLILLECTLDQRTKSGVN